MQSLFTRKKAPSRRRVKLKSGPLQSLLINSFHAHQRKREYVQIEERVANECERFVHDLQARLPYTNFRGMPKKNPENYKEQLNLTNSFLLDALLRTTVSSKRLGLYKKVIDCFRNVERWSPQERRKRYESMYVSDVRKMEGVLLALSKRGSQLVRNPMGLEDPQIHTFFHAILHVTTFLKPLLLYGKRFGKK